MLSKSVALPLFASLTLALAGCGPSRPASHGKYFLIASNINVPYWQAAAAGLHKTAAQLGVEAELTGPDTYTPRAQHEEFIRVLRLEPAGIMLSAGDRRLMRADIDDAIAKGIPVITVDSDAEFSKRLFFVGTDNRQAGAMIGKAIGATLKGKGNVVIFTMPEQLNLVERQSGVMSALAEFPKIKVTKVVDIQGDPRVAFDTTKQIVSGNISAVDAFVCLESVACPEVAEVLSREKVAGKLVLSMDADPRTLDWIKKGMISATVAQKPYTMAAIGLRMLVEMNRAKLPKLDQPWANMTTSPFPTFVDTGVTLINSDNVDGFTKEMELASN